MGMARESGARGDEARPAGPGRRPEAVARARRERSGGRGERNEPRRRRDFHVRAGLRYRLRAARDAVFPAVPLMNEATFSEPLRVGIGGPVGSGKTALTLALCRRLRERHRIAVVTNDI